VDSETWQAIAAAPSTGGRFFRGEFCCQLLHISRIFFGWHNNLWLSIL
jgi:hypothetical protein